LSAVLTSPPRSGEDGKTASSQPVGAGLTGPAVSCRSVGVRFFTDRRSVIALQNLSVDVAQGEFLTLLGPSGCGKSTLLRVVADLIAPTQGSLTVLGASPQEARLRRDIGFVFQDPALLPWRTALQNVELPLQVARQTLQHRGSGGDGRKSTRATPQELLELVGLKGAENAYPHELSGGMRQRVSIARALVSDPRVLLMDEPFGALDEITRDRLNEELRRLWKELGTTILFVTHSIYEAAYLGQRVMMMAANPGRVQELVKVDLPEDRTLAIRETPEFVALTAYLRRVLEVC
jgi:NitT/TauT family transport system ATP-binding protein